MQKEPDEPTPKGTPATPFEWIGGEATVQRLVDRFYDLMELEPNYQILRALHGTDLQNARQRLFWFLCGWLGGPQYYTEHVGHPMLRARHLPFAIGIRERDQWMDCMNQAMTDIGIQPELQKRLFAAFFQTADWMRNQKT